MSDLNALREAVLKLDGPVFAVLDGAQFEGVPTGLRIPILDQIDQVLELWCKRGTS